MREHKYRAWDKQDNKMYEKQAVDEDGYAVDINGDEAYSNEPFRILMQYTGLKDKNGVEIYEGDILQDDERPVECGVVEWDYDSLIVNNAKITPEWRKTSVESGLKYRHWIVIGNIYENPELLDKD